MRKVIKKTTTTTHTGGPDSGKNEELKPQGAQSGGASSKTSGGNSNAGGAPSSSGQAGASSKPTSNSGSDAKDSGNSPKPEKSEDKKPNEKANEKSDDEKDKDKDDNEDEGKDDADKNEGSDKHPDSDSDKSDKSEDADKEKGDKGLGKDGDDKDKDDKGNKSDDDKESEDKDDKSDDDKADKSDGNDAEKADDKSGDKGGDSKPDGSSGDNKSGNGDSGSGSKMDAAKDAAKNTGKAVGDEAKSQASGGDGKETAEMAAKLAKSRADDAKKASKEKADEADGKSDGKSLKDKAKEKAEKTDERMQDAAQLGAETAAEAYGGEAGRKAAHAGINIARKSGLIELLKKWRKRIMAIIMAIKAAIAAALAALIAYLIQMLMALIGALIQAIMQMFAWLIALIQLIIKIIAVIQAVIAVVVAVVTAVVTTISTVGAVMAGTSAYDPGSYEDYVADPIHDCVAEYDDAYRALFGGNGQDEHGENQAFGVLSDMDKRWKNGTLDLKRTLESAQKVRSFFREYGLTDTQCAAIVGTLYDMSALDYTFLAPVDDSKYDNQWFCKPGEADTTTDWTGKDFAGTSPAKKWIQDYNFNLYDMNGQESASGPHGNYPLPQGSHEVTDPATGTAYPVSNTTTKPSDYFAAHPKDLRAGMGIGAWRDSANTDITASNQGLVVNDATRLLEFTKQLDTRVQGVEDAVDAAEAWQKDMKAERANRLAVIYGDFGLNADGTLDPGTWTNQPGSHLYTLAYGPSEETKNNNDYWAQKDPTIDLPWVEGTSKGYLPDGATQGIALQQQYKNYRDILGGNITDLDAAITTMLTYYTDTYSPSRDKIKGLNTDTADAFVVENIKEASASAPSGDLVTFTDEVLGPKSIGTLGDVTVDYRLADTSALTAYLATLDSTDNWAQLKLKYDPAINGANILDNESTNLMYSLEAQYRYWDRAYVNRNIGYDSDGWWRVRPYGIIVNDSLPMDSSTASQSESYFYKSDSSCVKIRYDFNNGLYGVDHSYKAMHDYVTDTNTYSIHDLLANYGRAEVSESNGQSDSANTIWKIDTPYSALANSNPELQGASGKSTIKSYLDEYLLSPDLIFTNGGNTYTINASCNEMYRGVTKYVRSDGTVASRLLGGDGNYDSSDSSYMTVLRGLSYNASDVSWSWAGSSSMHKGLFWDYSDNKLIWDVPNKSLSMVPNQWSALDSIYHNVFYKMSTVHSGEYKYTWWTKPDGSDDYSHDHDADRAKMWKDVGGEAQGWSYQAAWHGNYTDDDYITAGGSSNWGYSIKYRNGTTGSWSLYNPADGTSKNVDDLTISNHTSTDSRWSTFKSKADTYISNQKTKISDFKTDAVDYETKYHEMLDKIADVEAKAELVKKAAEDFNKCSKMLADARMDFYEADEDMYQATSRYVEDEIRDGIGKPSGTWYSDFAQHYKLANGSVDNWGDYEVKLYNLWQKYIKPYREGDEPEDGQYLHWYDLDVQLLFMINDDKYKDKFAEWKSGDERRNHGLDQETKHFRDDIMLVHNGSIVKSTDSAFAFYYLFQYGSPYNLNIKEADKEGAAYKIVESWMEKTHPMYIQGFAEDFSFGTATASDAVWNPYALQGYYGSTLLEAADDGYNHSKVNKLGELANTCAYVDVMDNSTFAKASLLLLDPNRAMMGVDTSEVSDLYKYVDAWIFGTNPDGYKEAGAAIYQGHYADPMRWILLAASWSGCDINLMTGRVVKDDSSYFMHDKQVVEDTSDYGYSVYESTFTTKDLYDYLNTASSKDSDGWNQREEYDMTKPSTMHHTDYTDTTNNRKGLKDRDDNADAKNPDGTYKYKWAKINVEWDKDYDVWKKQLRPGDIIICNTEGGLTASDTEAAFFIWYGEDMINDFFPNLDYTYTDKDGNTVNMQPDDPAPGTWGSSGLKNGPMVAGYKTPWYNKPSLCQLYLVQAKAQAEKWDVFRLVHPDNDTTYRNVAWDYMTRMQYEPSDYVD